MFIISIGILLLSSSKHVLFKALNLKCNQYAKDRERGGGRMTGSSEKCLIGEKTY